MKIAVLGAGAMGSLFGGYLSKQNEVYLVDVNQALVNAINTIGLCIQEADGQQTVYPHAVTDTTLLGEMDLVIVFVKVLYTAAAIEGNRGLFGSKTLVLSMQNGIGHEEILNRYIPPENILIGATKHNCSLIEPGVIRHGGAGQDAIGAPDGSMPHAQTVASCLTACGLSTEAHPRVKQLIWNKVFVNTSISVMTGVLQMTMGQLAQEHAWNLVQTLAKEAVAVAVAEGYDFNEAEILLTLRGIVENAGDNITSIYADLRDGRKTEVDTISGAVVRAGKKVGVPTPTQAFVVELVHTMEHKAALPCTK